MRRGLATAEGGMPLTALVVSLNGDSRGQGPVVRQLQRRDSRSRIFGHYHHPAVLAVRNAAKALAELGEDRSRAHPGHFRNNLVAPNPRALSVSHEEIRVQRG